MKNAGLKAASTLELVAERKLSELLDRLAPSRLEASGVCIQDRAAIVVFDNLAQMARVDLSLELGAPATTLMGLPGKGLGYEGIAWDQEERRFYVLVESVEHPQGHRSMVEIYDEGLVLLDRHWGEIPLADKNKGGEGIAHLRRHGEEYLLGLCEGNNCQGGKKGSKPGGGRIHVHMRTPGGWVHRDTIKLPERLPFEDYSGLDMRGDRMAVVSQASSALWVGTLAADAWRCEDEGEVYLFPINAKGKTRYCNVEGVAWLDDSEIVVVSDRRKSSQPPRCAKSDQSIHVFRIP